MLWPRFRSRAYASAVDVVEFRPTPDQFAWTFGGVAPTHRITPGTALRLWTEDAFSGRLQRTTDRPSAGAGHDRGQPADRAVLRGGRRARRHPRHPHRRPATGPRLGGVHHDPVLRRAHRHRPHRAAAGAAARAHLDLPARPGRGHRALRGRRTSPSTCRSRRCWARSASPLRAARCARASCPTCSAATWTPRRCARAPPATWASTCPARSSRSATGTTGRARAKAAARPSRARWTSRSSST